MKRKSLGRIDAWRREDNSRYISRSIARDVHRLRVAKSNPKRLFGCMGGPFDGCKIYLSGTIVANVCTAEFTLGRWHGRYVWDEANSGSRGNRKVVWNSTPRWCKE